MRWQQSPVVQERSPDGADHPRYRADIDGLRAIAILSVVVCHAFPSLLPGGFIGVDIFFVISGYLISSILLKGLQRSSFGIGSFYARRVNRLFPALFVVLASVLLAGYVLETPEELVSLGWQTTFGTLFASNLYFWHSIDYFAGLGEGNPLLHLWSLGIEEQFYLLWPLLLFLVHKRSWNAKHALWVTALVSFAYSSYAVHNDMAAAFYSPLSRFWELACGGLLAANHATSRQDVAGKPHRYATLAGICALAVIAACCAFFNAQTDFPGPWALLPAGAAVILISSGPRSWINRTILSSRLAVWIGLISYPLYLWHWPLLVFLRAVDDDASPVAMRNATILVVLAAFLLAWLTYRYIEQPLRRTRGGGRKIAGLVGAVASCTAVGLIFVAGKGIPTRIPAEVRPYTVINMRDVRWSQSLRPNQCHNMVYTYRTLGDPAVCFPNGPHPHVMLWGDSHAAALFSGMNAIAKRENISVWQITTDASAAFFDKTRKNNMHKTLAWVNDQVLSRMVATPPDIIVLHGYWGGYQMSPEELQTRIAESVRHIRQALPGVTVVVLGPVPTWKKPLPAILVDFAIRRHSRLPDSRIDFGLAPATFAIDRVLADELPASGVPYVSAIAQMCEGKKCLYRLGKQPTDLAYVDAQHISTEGSIYLAEHVISQILATWRSKPAH